MDRANRQEISPAYDPWESVTGDVIVTDFGDVGSLENGGPPASTKYYKTITIRKYD